MRSFNLFKSKIRKYFKIFIILYIIFFIIDLAKINYKFENLRFVTFDNLNLSSSLNKNIYTYYNEIYTKLLLKTPKHENFWDIDKTEQSKLKKNLHQFKLQN